MEIIGLEGMTGEKIQMELNRGGKFVIFKYCISIIIVTSKQPSDIYFIKSGQGTFKISIGYTLASLLLGWWGIPWGPIYTIESLITNCRGGKNVTNEVLAYLRNISEDITQPGGFVDRGQIMHVDIKCPKCGSEMVVRPAKKGPNAGRKFYVCMYYPECKGKIPIE